MLLIFVCATDIAPSAVASTTSLATPVMSAVERMAIIQRNAQQRAQQGMMGGFRPSLSPFLGTPTSFCGTPTSLYGGSLPPSPSGSMSSRYSRSSSVTSAVMKQEIEAELMEKLKAEMAAQMTQMAAQMLQMQGTAKNEENELLKEQIRELQEKMEKAKQEASVKVRTSDRRRASGSASRSVKVSPKVARVAPVSPKVARVAPASPKPVTLRPFLRRKGSTTTDSVTNPLLVWRPSTPDPSQPKLPISPNVGREKENSSSQQNYAAPVIMPSKATIRSQPVRKAAEGIVESKVQPILRAPVTAGRANATKKTITITKTDQDSSPRAPVSARRQVRSESKSPKATTTRRVSATAHNPVIKDPKLIVKGGPRVSGQFSMTPRVLV